MPLIKMARAENEADVIRWERDVRRLEGPKEAGGGILLYSTDHGLCLRETESNGRDDSDFYMTVWNPETCEPEEVLFATTRGWCYPCLGSRVDAEEGVRYAHAQWRQRVERMISYQHVEALLHVPHAGAEVVVARGRKVPKGTRGVLLHVRADVWGFNPGEMIGLLVNEQGAWLVAIKHCDMVAPAPGVRQALFALAEG